MPMDDVDMATTRINKDAAMLVKSRVALFEGYLVAEFQRVRHSYLVEKAGRASLHNNYQYRAETLIMMKYFLEQVVEASNL